MFGFDFLFSVPFLPSGNQKFKKANICDETSRKDIKMNKINQPEKKEVDAKEVKELFNVPIDNKSKNADAFNGDTFNGDLKKKNSTSNKKKIQITTANKTDKNRKLLKNATKLDTQQEIDNKAQSSATNDDTVKK